MKKAIREYMAAIGEKGGCKSRRKLTPGQARDMVRVREARKAFRKYYAHCFWSYNPDLEISIKDVPWIGEQMMKNGDRETWETGAKLCR
jgi:hypothetical protein